MSNYPALLAPVANQMYQVEELLRKQAADYHPQLQAALALILSSGGKRIRPLITLLTGKMLHGDETQLIILGAAVELLHTASLVHDDLIDESLLRRGSPTLNSHWSAGATVLSGDFLFARAAKLAAQTENINVIKEFADSLSTIVNGEISQLFSARCSVNRTEYYQRIYAKTAALFEMAAWSAACISKADESTIEAMKNYGYELGLAFQIIDDILDYTADQAQLGKPIGNDLRHGLITLPAILYVENHPNQPLAIRMAQGKCADHDDDIHLAVDAIRSSGAIELAYAAARQHVQHAKECLNLLPAAPERELLAELADFVISRTV